MKIIIAIIIVLLIAIIVAMLKVHNDITLIKNELLVLNKQYKEVIDDIFKFAAYKNDLEKRISKFNDNAYKYKEEVKNEFDSVNNNIKSIKNNNKNFAMQLGKLRNDYKDNAKYLVVLNNKLTEHLEK